MSKKQRKTIKTIASLLISVGTVLAGIAKIIMALK
jgi:hypothetical protein